MLNKRVKPDAFEFETNDILPYLNPLGGTTERWTEFHISRYPNFGISMSSRVEGSHSALKGALGSSAGTLYTAGQKLNHWNSQRSEQLGVLNSSENIIVRYDIRTQVETSMLCSAICRSALELIHAEVMKKVHGQEEPGTMDNCNCATRIRYLLPCSHQIQLGVPIQVAQVHPRWRIQGPLPAVTGPRVNLDLSAIAGLKDPAVLVRRKGRPRGTRRLSTSAEIVQRAADRAERVRRCGSCRMVGHTRRTCPVPDNDAANGTGEEDERQDKNEKDGSTIEEIWTNILSTIKDANVDGSDNGG